MRINSCHHSYSTFTTSSRYFFFSPLLKRTFSWTQTSQCLTFASSKVLASMTSRPNSRPWRATTGFKEISSSYLPSVDDQGGRARSPRRPSQSHLQGRQGLPKALVVGYHAVLHGPFKSPQMTTALPLRSRSFFNLTDKERFPFLKGQRNY